MGKPKRGRGRPVGWEIDDRESIGDAVDLMTEDRSITFTSALRRTGTRDPTDIRRCQTKWAKIKATMPISVSKFLDGSFSFNREFDSDGRPRKTPEGDWIQ